MNELQLSEQLIKSVQATLLKHDQHAEDDAVSVQYLAAIIGFVVGKQSLSTQEKKEFLEHLYAFSNQVLDDMTQNTSQDKPQPAPPPPQEAFGIWKPGDN